MKPVKFIDLFAGIGGFHEALNGFDSECVFASEWDKEASKTYFENYNLKPFGDITKIDGKIRRLTPRECARLQGFPDSFILNSSQNQCYKQFGNSVGVNVLKQIIKNIYKTGCFLENRTRENCA